MQKNTFHMLTHKLVQKSIGSQIREPNRTEPRTEEKNRTVENSNVHVFSKYVTFLLMNLQGGF